MYPVLFHQKKRRLEAIFKIHVTRYSKSMWSQDKQKARVGNKIKQGVLIKL